MNENNMQATFEDIYKTLITFSNQIEGIRRTTYELTILLSDSFPAPWKEFLNFFSMGAYFHHRCQGYVECLRVTNAYSPESIEIWIHELVDPAADNFMQALDRMNAIEQIPAFKGTNQLKILEMQIKAFQKTAMKIIKSSKELDAKFAH